MQSSMVLFTDCTLVSFPCNLFDLENNPFLLHFSYIICAVINGQMEYEEIHSGTGFYW